MGYYTHEFQLHVARTNEAINTAGGAALILKQGLPDKAALYNPDNDFASLSNPISLNRGQGRFAVLDTVETVDILLLCPGGQALYLTNVKPQSLSRVAVDTQERNQILKLPYSIADASANVEYDTGLDLPANAVVLPDIALLVHTASTAGNSLDLGTLTGETGADPDGFLNDLPTNGTAGTVVAAKSAATATRGALLGGATLDRGYSTDLNTAKSISYTLAASFATGKGWIFIPYMLCN